MFRKSTLLAAALLVPLAAQTLSAQTIVLPSGAVYERLDKKTLKSISQVSGKKAVKVPARFVPQKSQALPLRRATQTRPIQPQAFYNYGAAAGPKKHHHQMHRSGGHYPQLNAPLYPSPVQNVPYQIGGSAITNPILAPHEMLYPHEYRALYGPYYWRVRGGWLWTPFGIESHDKWELQGTQVKVKYRSTHNPFAFFIPPFNPLINLNQVRN